MKRVIFFILAVLAVKSYSQEITVTVTGIHHYAKGYYTLQEGTSNLQYRLVNKELKEGYPKFNYYNNLNFGILYTQNKWVLGGYFNSYYRLSVVLGRNITLYKKYIDLTVGISTGYKTDNIRTNKSQFYLPGLVTPMYTLNFNIGRVKLMTNHFFTGVGMRFDL